MRPLLWPVWCWPIARPFLQGTSPVYKDDVEQRNRNSSKTRQGSAADPESYQAVGSGDPFDLQIVRSVHASHVPLDLISNETLGERSRGGGEDCRLYVVRLSPVNVHIVDDFYPVLGLVLRNDR